MLSDALTRRCSGPASGCCWPADGIGVAHGNFRMGAAQPDRAAAGAGDGRPLADVEISGGQLTPSLVAIIMAMGLLGPAAAAACGIAAMVLKSAVRRLPPAQWLNNLAICTASPLPEAGCRRGKAASATPPTTSRTRRYSGSSCSGSCSHHRCQLPAVRARREGRGGPPFDPRPLELIALLPGELAVGVLATILAVAYTGVGLPALIAAITVLIIFRQLTVALLRSEERAEQLLARSRQLVGLQLGVLRTLVGTGDARPDHRTTRRRGGALLQGAGL